MTIRWETIRPTRPDRLDTSEDVLGRAIGASRQLRAFLQAAASANEPVRLLVNDPHRATQTRPALAAIGRLADELGIRPRFVALVATGTHSFGSTERRAFEEETFGGGLPIEQVAWHDAGDDGDLVGVAGVRMHCWVAQGAFLLPIGSVEPHYFAGLTGPHKTATVGCMAEADIERNHAGALAPGSDVLRLRGNPVHEGIAAILTGLEAAGKSICAIGEVIDGATVLAASLGNPLTVLDDLLPVVREVYVHTVNQPVDVLHLRVPPPLGRNLYQGDKAIKNNHRAVRDGGGIVVEAGCPEGIGQDAFMELLRGSNDYAGACRMVDTRGYRLGDHKAVKLRHLMDEAERGVHVALVSPHLSDAELRDTGIRVFLSIAAALMWLETVVTGPLQSGLVIEDAGMLTVAPSIVPKA